MMPSSNINFYNAVDLDSIIENAITKAAEHEPDFIVANEEKVTAALRKYTENILWKSTPESCWTLFAMLIIAASKMA